ncbi:MAG TPA: acyl-CoA dehydrogenase [Candidatus Sulfotelmatobacter sp.]|nr:acyl-CoA dehydrogenase [Candidatus Sulfotelmatobacter sp.]
MTAVATAAAPVAPRRRELDFQLYDVLDLEELLRFPYYAEHDRATVDGILDTAYAIAGEVYAPFAAALDAYPFRLVDGEVAMPDALKAAVRAYVDAGFVGATFSAEDGGLQLPDTVTSAAGLVFSAANNGANGYTFLTIGAAHLLAAFANDEQRERWMAPLVEGRYLGTMALSEPQAGSSLGDITTKAEPAGDGTYRLTGTKMWISAAEHDLAENIVNLVLAKIPGGPPGVKGSSLFIVPKYLVDAQGRRAQRNDVVVTGLNHKLGQRGIINTVLTFGERGACVGYLVGEPHDGMRQMFHMMNEARIAVGAGASALNVAAYEYALQYAKDRPQGRRLTDKNPLAPPVPIVEHADVKRMLLRAKAIAEGGLALVLWCSRLIDVTKAHPDAQARTDAELLVDVLTPVAKTWPSERGVECTSLAIQVLGGYGYSPEYPVERHLRDQRLNPIHEGTTGIQGLDLLGRKLRLHDGAGLRLFLAALAGEVDAAAGVELLREERAALSAASATLERVTRALLAAQLTLGPERALAESTDYLDAFGTLAVAGRWLAMARAAAASPPGDFTAGKLATCRYFFRHFVADAVATLERIEQLDDVIVGVAPEML